MVLVVGATGLLGSEICLLLRQRGRHVRALIRPSSDASRIARLRTAGTELATGDLKDRASIDAACRGATAVISTASSTLSRQPGDSLEAVDRRGQLDLSMPPTLPASSASCSCRSPGSISTSRCRPRSARSRIGCEPAA